MLSYSDRLVTPHVCLRTSDTSQNTHEHQTLTYRHTHAHIIEAKEKAIHKQREGVWEYSFHQRYISYSPFFFRLWAKAQRQQQHVHTLLSHSSHIADPLTIIPSGTYPLDLFGRATRHICVYRGASGALPLYTESKVFRLYNTINIYQLSYILYTLFFFARVLLLSLFIYLYFCMAI